MHGRGLESLVDQQLVVTIKKEIPLPTRNVICLLRHVEPSGLWLESASFAALAHASVKVAVDVASRIMFIPFHNIDYIFEHLDRPPVGAEVKD